MAAILSRPQCVNLTSLSVVVAACELVGPNARAYVSGLQQAFWSLGIFFLLFTASLIRTRMGLELANTVPCVLYFVTLW